jgi:hypothetical protein
VPAPYLQAIFLAELAFSSKAHFMPAFVMITGRQ